MSGIGSWRKQSSSLAIGSSACQRVAVETAGEIPEFGCRLRILFGGWGRSIVCIRPDLISGAGMAMPDDLIFRAPSARWATDAYAPTQRTGSPSVRSLRARSPPFCHRRIGFHRSAPRPDGLSRFGQSSRLESQPRTSGEAGPGRAEHDLSPRVRGRRVLVSENRVCAKTRLSFSPIPLDFKDQAP